MSEQPNAFPSLTVDQHEPPYGWIQWKGTNVCMDIHCTCGAFLHADEDFFYHFKCGQCGQVYEVSGFVRLIPLDFTPDRTLTLRDDDEPTVENPSPDSVTLQVSLTASGLWTASTSEAKP